MLRYDLYQGLLSINIPSWWHDVSVHIVAGRHASPAERKHADPTYCWILGPITGSMLALMWSVKQGPASVLTSPGALSEVQQVQCGLPILECYRGCSQRGRRHPYVPEYPSRWTPSPQGPHNTKSIQGALWSRAPVFLEGKTVSYDLDLRRPHHKRGCGHSVSH